MAVTVKLTIDDTALNIDLHKTSSGFTIDLSDLDFVDAYGLILIAVVTASATRPVVLKQPRSQKLRNYLARMELGTWLDQCPNVHHDIRQVAHLPTETVLFPIEAFSSEFAAERLADEVVRHCGGNPGNRVWQVITELGANACEHSGRGGGILAAQGYRSADGRPSVVLAIGDLGCGIAEHMGRIHPGASESDLVRRAIEYGGTGVAGGDGPDPGRGVGLYDACQAASKLLIRCNGVLLSADNQVDTETRRSLEGTIVAAKFEM